MSDPFDRIDDRPGEPDAPPGATDVPFGEDPHAVPEAQDLDEPVGNDNIRDGTVGGVMGGGGQSQGGGQG